MCGSLDKWIQRVVMLHSQKVELQNRNVVQHSNGAHSQISTQSARELEPIKFKAMPL